MKEVKKHLEMLGLKVRDRVSGMEGIVTSVGFDLYGCVQVILNPGIDKDGKLADQVWLDIARLEVLDKTPVMKLPNFISGSQARGEKGPAEKPQANKV